jgi:acyl carrier protein
VKDDQAREAIQQALATVAPEADLDDVGATERLRDALDLDSLDFLSLVERLHEITGVAIPEADYGKVATVGELSAYLLAHAS